MKSAGLAAVLSFLIPGLGQVYNGQIMKGVLTVCAYAVAWWLVVILVGFILAPLIWIWSMYDAYSYAQRYNRSGFRF